jgi:hypothetical protein
VGIEGGEVLVEVYFTTDSQGTPELEETAYISSWQILSLLFKFIFVLSGFLGFYDK